MMAKRLFKKELPKYIKENLVFSKKLASPNLS